MLSRDDVTGHESKLIFLKTKEAESKAAHKSAFFPVQFYVQCKAWTSSGERNMKATDRPKDSGDMVTVFTQR